MRALVRQYEIDNAHHHEEQDASSSNHKNESFLRLVAGYNGLVRRTLPRFVAHHVRPTSLTLSSPTFMRGYFADWDRGDEWLHTGAALWGTTQEPLLPQRMHDAFGAMAWGMLRAWQLHASHRLREDEACCALYPLLRDSMRVLIMLTCAENESVADAGEKCESAAAAAAVSGDAPQRVAPPPAPSP